MFVEWMDLWLGERVMARKMGSSESRAWPKWSATEWTRTRSVLGPGTFQASRALTTDPTPERGVKKGGDLLSRQSPATTACHLLSATLSPFSQQTPTEPTRGQALGGSSREGRAMVWPRSPRSSASGEGTDTLTQSKDGT